MVVRPIHAKQGPMVDLMVSKLGFETRRAVQLLACLGNLAEILRCFDRSRDPPRSSLDAALWRPSVNS